MMRTPIRLLLLISAAVILGSCSSSKDEPLFFKSKRPAAEAEPPVKDVPADILSTQRAFSQVSKKVTPIVVNISTISRKKLVRPFPDLPPLFEEFFGGGPQTRRDKSLGSGFIISRDGFIVTNEHVVRDAESIRVKLSNDKVYEARVVGGDPKTDIAVIKIDAGDLPVAVLGDSDRLEVGQWAIAIGNPFGLERSMTVGIISATGRSNVGIESIENFIQTDASINPGNSGGPLFSSSGKVIGINTAIIANGQGIGFAIPINMAKSVAEQLKATGKVVRGYLGVNFDRLSPKLAKSLGLASDKGVIVTHVEKGSPADKAGLKIEDVIVQFDGKPVNAETDLPKVVAGTPVGKQVQIVVFRKAKRLVLSATVAQGRSGSTVGEPATASIGISVRELTPELARQLGLKDAKGLVVSEVKPGSSADEAGMVRGDLVLEFNGQPVDSLEGFAALAAKVAKGEVVRLLLRRPDGSFGYVAVTAE